MFKNLVYKFEGEKAYNLTPEDIEVFKKNQAKSFKEHKRLTKFEVAAKLKRKQKWVYAPLAQLVEVTVLEAVQSEFESQGAHQV